MLLSAKTFSLSDIEKETSEQNMKLAGFYIWLESVVIGLTAVFLVFTFLFNSYSVDGWSMTPTFSHNDRIVLRLLYFNPKQGDIVVFTEPNKLDNMDQKPLVKRIIATEGQEVDIDFDKGIVYVDKKPLDEKYVYEPIREIGSNPMDFPITVQPDKVFVLGDNRNNSRDSRDLSVGQVDVKYIRGKAILRYWPTDRIDLIKQPEIFD